MVDGRTRAVAISRALVEARQEARALPGFPGELPDSLEQAYEVQHRSRQAWNDSVGGWKVGGVPEGLREQLGAKWLAGPIFARSIVHSNGSAPVEMPVYDGFAAVEAEFVFRLAERAEDDRMHIGVEIASSPLPAINDIGPLAVICDFGNNRGLVVGPEIDDWRNIDLSPISVETEIEEEIRGTAEITAFPRDALAALSFLRDHARRHGIELTPGTYVSSGAVTGVHEARAGASATVGFGPFGTLRVRLVRATAQAE